MHICQQNSLMQLTQLKCFLPTLTSKPMHLGSNCSLELQRNVKQQQLTKIIRNFLIRNQSSKLRISHCNANNLQLSFHNLNNVKISSPYLGKQLTVAFHQFPQPRERDQAVTIKRKNYKPIKPKLTVQGSLNSLWFPILEFQGVSESEEKSVLEI